MICRRVWKVSSLSLNILRRISSPAYEAVQSTSSASDNQEANTVTKGVSKSRSNKKNEEIWKSIIIQSLSSEFQQTKKENSFNLNIRHSSTQLIRFAVDDDILSIVTYMENFLRRPGKDSVTISPTLDELLAVSTKLIQRSLETYIAGEKNPDDKLLTSICYTYGKLWPKIWFFGSDSQITTILLLDTFERWLQIRTTDEHTEELERIIENMREKLSRTIPNVYMKNSRLILTDDNIETLRKTAQSLGIQIHWKEITNLGYDPKIAIVNHLREPCPSENYLENPFKTDKADRDYYIKELEKQLKLESSSWLVVNNFWKSRGSEIESSAEDLIREWKWREKIEETLTSKLSDLAVYPVKVYLSILNRKELVNSILEAVKAACSLGQNLIPVPIFQSYLLNPVIKKVHMKFIEKLGEDTSSIWNDIMSDYLYYFEDREIARTNTHREWWNKVCHSRGIPADYEAPFAHTHPEMRDRLNIFLTDVATEACKFPSSTKANYGLVQAFSFKNVPIEEESRVTEEGRYNITRMIQLNNELVEMFERHQFDHLLFPTGELPMTVPPRPWIDKGVGGSEFTRGTPIIRMSYEYPFFDVNKEMTKRLKNEFQARPVFDALNQLGSTPWIINESMLDVLVKVFSLADDYSQRDFLKILSVPLKESCIPVPTQTEFFGKGVDTTKASKQQWKAFYKAEKAAVKFKYEMNSLWYWMMYRVTLARHFCGQTLFFPHNMDFRGRVYPISPYLNHMGDDVNRCILKFAKGKPLGSDGLKWLKLHCINLTGKYKRKSIKERLEIAEQLLPDILDSANKPLNGKRWWVSSDEPWQTLAVCMELRDALAFPGDPSTYISHLPVHQDGSCNGLQHYAALGRDKQGGSEVNLLPSEIPSDVYSSVAARVEQKRIQDEKNGGEMELVQKLRMVMPQAIPRKVVKQTVMTTVYGVTQYGAVLQIKKQLKALGIADENIAKFAAYLAKRTFDSLHDAFTSSMQLKDWFRNCAKGTNSLLRTIEWVTPLGLPVAQPYLKDKITEKKLILTPVLLKQVDAFPPNFVHSLDSTHMMQTSLECSRKGITFAAVHDCYWTHASTVDMMNEICRDQFILLHNQPLVDQLSEWFLKTYLPSSILSKMGEEDRLRFIKIFTPNVQPGDLDINEVKKSVYFFS